MNDKNFIEELRQKREEYGVTQTRLAVACGISREYYNRIEKGKQPLNDELREIIEKQIERFNPQEPLFLLIDYFRVRFPTTDALAIIRDVLQLKSNYMLYEDYGKYGYESKYVLGEHQYHVFHAGAFRCFIGTERQRLSANGMLSAGTGTLMV